MRATIAAALAAAMLWAGAASAAWTPWERMDPEDGQIAMGGVWENTDYHTSTERNRGKINRAEDSEWRNGSDIDPRFVQVTLHWTEHAGGGFWGDWLNSREGFMDYFGLEGRTTTDGPTIGTVRGDVETFGFRDDGNRECLGFWLLWKRATGYSWVAAGVWRRALWVYVCTDEGGMPMTEWRLVETLRDLSIEGEFDALVE